MQGYSKREYVNMYLLLKHIKCAKTQRQSEQTTDIKNRCKQYTAYSDMVEEDGFGPSKSETTDLQSAPFGHSGTPPCNGAGERNRTINLLITNQLLYR